ncbi:MAG: hypothetical protein RL205_59 [Actinomycetota bacterium]
MTEMGRRSNPLCSAQSLQCSYVPAVQQWVSPLEDHVSHSDSLEKEEQFPNAELAGSFLPRVRQAYAVHENELTGQCLEQFLR